MDNCENKKIIVRVWQELDGEEYTTTFNLLDKKDLTVFYHEFDEFNKIELER